MSQKGTATELGTERIGKLLMQYAIPAIIAMTASSLYNMVDSIFIGHALQRRTVGHRSRGSRMLAGGHARPH